MILMYHHVAPVQAVPRVQAPNEGWEVRISPQGFERQLIALQGKGYCFVSLGEMVDDIRTKGVENSRTVAVTFDDGWVDNCRFALPVLKRLSVPATFFVTSAHLRSGTQDQKRMSVAQLKELLAAGMGIGGHSRTHPDLTKLAPEQTREEIAGCKADLEHALGVHVPFFAYPGGAFNRQVARLAEQVGFAAACSVLGPARNDTSSLYWLYRDTLTESLSSPHDIYRLSPVLRRLIDFRVKQRLRLRLACSTRAEASSL
jgi:peptidoglycan/xylan/chitin deacetylase (PgdA/CDA1 family)